MKIFTLDEYKNMLKPAYSETHAFLRISRGKGLFVTDITVRCEDYKKRLTPFSEDFEIEEDGKLIYLTPRYGCEDITFEETITLILKANGEKKEKLIRNALSKAMRMKNREQREILESLLKGETEL